MSPGRASLTFGLLMAFAGSATATPPSLVSVGVDDRQPSATYSAPRAAAVTVYIASHPGRATSAFRWSDSIDLTLTATRLGERLPYRVCYRAIRRAQRCVAGVLKGIDWDSADDDTVSVRTARLSRVTKFTWHVNGRPVATRRVRVR